MMTLPIKHPFVLRTSGNAIRGLLTIMIKMIRCLGLGLSLMWAATSASAQLYTCFDPEPPSCLTSYGTFDDDWAFDRCKTQMDNYRFEVGQFRDCLQRTMVDEIDQYGRAVDYWNCKARGDAYCSRP